MADDVGDNELGLFLRSRRERTDPASAGVVQSSRRRVPGLRREELALLAGVSVSYYTRLEQGTDRRPSPEVLDAIARVLQLDDAERRYLHAVGSPTVVAAPSGAPGDGVQQLLRRWSDLPAFVVNPRRDVLAATPLAGAVNPAWAVGTNLVEFTFTDGRARQVYPAWADIAAQAVSGLRSTSAHRAAEVEGLISSLRKRSEEFRRLWDGRDVVDRTIGTKQVRVPDGRVVTLSYETFELSGGTGQVLYVYFPAEGSADAAVVADLFESSRSEPHP